MLVQANIQLQWFVNMFFNQWHNATQRAQTSTKTVSISETQCVCPLPDSNLLKYLKVSSLANALPFQQINENQTNKPKWKQTFLAGVMSPDWLTNHSIYYVLIYLWSGKFLLFNMTLAALEKKRLAYNGSNTLIQIHLKHFWWWISIQDCISITKSLCLGWLF